MFKSYRDVREYENHFIGYSNIHGWMYVVVLTPTRKMLVGLKDGKVTILNEYARFEPKTATRKLG